MGLEILALAFAILGLGVAFYALIASFFVPRFNSQKTEEPIESQGGGSDPATADMRSLIMQDMADRQRDIETSKRLHAELQTHSRKNKETLAAVLQALDRSEYEEIERVAGTINIRNREERI